MLHLCGLNLKAFAAHLAVFMCRERLSVDNTSSSLARPGIHFRTVRTHMVETQGRFGAVLQASFAKGFLLQASQYVSSIVSVSLALLSPSL